jgi:hypothetical protein
MAVIAESKINAVTAMSRTERERRSVMLPPKMKDESGAVRTGAQRARGIIIWASVS